ncbi:LysR family transcriptional regulator, partial [bacterium]|nr:LysR family transcriptional regulator [bacterium]
SQGAVSRHVAILEDWLNVKLFVRVHRGIELTAQGSTYFRMVKTAFDQIEAGARQLKLNRDDRLLRLKLAPTFARFHAEQPKIDVQITTSHQPADFDREDVDVSIYSWPAAPAGPGYRRLFGEVLLPVCAPGLLTQCGPLRVPEDLANHVLLCSINRPLDWPAWLAATPELAIDGNGGVKFENAALAYQAAVDELGVMMAQYAFVEDDLRTGRLVAPLALHVSTPRAYFLASHPNRLQAAVAESRFL